VRNFLRENLSHSGEIESKVRAKGAGGTAQAVQRAAGSATTAAAGSGGAEDF